MQQEAPKEKRKDFDPNRPVPQLQDVTEGNLQVAINVLTKVGALNKLKTRNAQGQDGLDLYKQQNLRPLRKALASCLELQKRAMFNGKSEEDHYEQRKAERSLKRQKMAEADHQKKYIQATALRKGRMDKLERLKNDAKEEEHARLMSMMVPDGHVDTTAGNKLLLENGTTSAQDNDDDNEQDVNGVKLPKLRSCYVCKIRFRDLHAFYDQLCPSCALLNWTKRHQTASLAEKVAVVTGSRVKIGYQTCLKLLRAGCHVVATTRFPNSAAATYRQEADFGEWSNRLHIYGLDLRDVTGLEAFTRFLKMKYSGGIDILINNACQTVRRPRGYYLPMVEKEQALWTNGDDSHKSLLGGCREFEKARRKLVIDHARAKGGGTKQLENASDQQLLPMPMDTTDDSKPAAAASAPTDIVAASKHGDDIEAPFEKTGISHSAAMSQMIILPEDAGVSDNVLPPGVSDINGQQLDLRHTNSWLLKMEEVSTPEIMECMFVNAIAPFVLNSRLKPLMTCPNDESRPDRFIINVSAMEGKFNRYKLPNHPHTNMAKAAMNMMTRTSAEDLAKKHRIYMNSVDTGWINDENPLEKASKIAKANNFQTPIDEVDAAARILDPIFAGTKPFGKFLKDYRDTEW